MVVSPRANSSYEGRRLEVRVEFTGPVNERSNRIYFLYTSNPDISSILPRKQLVTLVTHCLILCNYITNQLLVCFMSVSVCMFALSTLRLTKFLLKNFTTTTTYSRHIDGGEIPRRKFKNPPPRKSGSLINLASGF